MFQSIVKELGQVNFPQFLGEKVYMRKFNKQQGLPADLQRWQPTVDAMLKDIDCEGDIFIMVDQMKVQAGNNHRRGGAHIDGYWIEGQQCHGHGGGHGLKIVDWSYWGNEGADFSEKEGIILASNIQACKAFAGEYQGIIGEGGDCSKINKASMEVIEMKPNTVYAGNVSMLHESIPVTTDCLRTLVRLNVKGWTPN